MAGLNYLQRTSIKLVMADLEVKPQRIQRTRLKGFKMPPNTVYVGRPTKWGNPWKVHPLMSAQECVDKYEHEIIMNPAWRATIKKELKGKNLACFCRVGDVCHADVLLKYANE